MRKLVVIYAIVLLAVAVQGQASIVNFDDLPTNPQVDPRTKARFSVPIPELTTAGGDSAVRASHVNLTAPAMASESEV